MNMYNADDAVITSKDNNRFCSLKKDIEYSVKISSQCGFFEKEFYIENDYTGNEWAANNTLLEEAVDYFRTNGYFAELRHGIGKNMFIVYINWRPGYVPNVSRDEYDPGFWKYLWMLLTGKGE